MAYEAIYSQEDLEVVRNAKIRFATGAKETRIAIAGKIIEYAQQDLDKLNFLMSEIRADLKAADDSAGFILTTISKGR